tara:strand:- start:137 stop:478 length:342 start_codon:yes stop_codon:yes gene_type:complete
MAIRKIVSRSIGVDVIAAEDLAANSVTVSEILDGAVTLDKIATAAQSALGGGFFQGETSGGNTSAGKGHIFRVHEPTLNTNVTIASTDNALAAGPLAVADGVTLTVSGNLSIV